jgi:hypothetical protein
MERQRVGKSREEIETWRDREGERKMERGDRDMER